MDKSFTSNCTGEIKVDPMTFYRACVFDFCFTKSPQIIEEHSLAMLSMCDEAGTLISIKFKFFLVKFSEFSKNFPKIHSYNNSSTTS